MKHVLLLTWLLLNAAFSFAQLSNPHLNNQLIIGFSDDSNQADRQQLIDQLGTVLQGMNTNPNGSTMIGQVVLVLVPGYPVEVDGQVYLNEIDLISTIHGNHAKVDNADLNYILTTEQYSFDEFIGSTELEAFSPISASCEASYPGGPLEGEVEPSETRIKVGVLDTGLDPYYPTINQYVAGEINVLTDDTNPEAGITISFGYNPANPLTLDDNGHGTAVAGIIAGLSDRANLSPFNLELYVIKCFDENGNASMFNLLQAMRMTKLFDLDVVNLSWSYLTVKEDEYTTALEDAIAAFSYDDHGIIVAGAGNDMVDLDTEAYAPGSLPNISNLITVGGTNGEERQCNGGLAEFSNYGDPVEIAAPSASMSVPGLDGYWALNASGTSFATPIVTAAIIQSWMAHDDLIDDILLPGGKHPITGIVTNTATYLYHLDQVGIEGAVNFSAACVEGGVLSLQSDNNEGRPSEIGLASADHKATAGFGRGLNVSPNPFTSQLTVSFDHAPGLPTFFELLTLQGAKITGLHLEGAAAGTTTISVPTELPSGPYLLRVRHNGAVSAKVIIKD